MSVDPEVSSSISLQSPQAAPLQHPAQANATAQPTPLKRRDKAITILFYEGVLTTDAMLDALIFMNPNIDKVGLGLGGLLKFAVYKSLRRYLLLAYILGSLVLMVAVFVYLEKSV